MFNFGKLKVVSPEELDTTSSFVGIRRGLNNSLEFSLPKGFTKFPRNDFNATKTLFFGMYQTFKKFAKTCTPSPTDKSLQNKDNTSIKSNGYAFKDSEDNDVVLYSKITLIEDLLDAFNDLSLDFLESAIGKNEPIDYKDIHQYLDKAIYLEGDTFYIEEIDSVNNILHYKQNSLINLFCFIIRELKNEMGSPVDSRISELANHFAYSNLSPDQSLFNEATFETTIISLKNLLHEIDTTTPYKDGRYWKLFDAVEKFLYGDLNTDDVNKDGIYWGISNFFQVWEDMCATFAFKQRYSIVFADTRIVYKGNQVDNYTIPSTTRRIYKQPDIDYPFFFEFKSSRRWLRPDLVQIIDTKEDNIFSSYIEVRERRKDHNSNRIDFDIILLDFSKEDLYKKFCTHLDTKAIKPHGARKAPKKRADVTSFLNYSPRVLETQTNNFITSNKLKTVDTPTKFRILDWKYVRITDLFGDTLKVRHDVTKQLCYEFCLSNIKIREDNNIKREMESWFVIPIFTSITTNEDSPLHQITDERIHKKITDNEIKVYGLDFYFAQKLYIAHD